MSILARAAAVLGLALVTSCGSSRGDPTTPAAGLAGAMASVGAPDAPDASFGYTDLARLRQLGVVDPRNHAIDEHWRTAATAGFRSVANVVTRLPAVTGVDLTKADRAVTVSDDGQAVRIDGGFDAATVLKRIKRLGPSGRSFGNVDGYSFGGDNMVDSDSAIGAQLPVGNALDQVVVRGASFAGSPDTTTMQDVLGGSPSLLDAPNYRAIARCLGDVVVAVVWQPRSDNANSVLLGAGVRDMQTAAGDHDEVVCAVPVSSRSAAVRDAFRSRLAVDAVDPQFLIPNSRYATASRVDVAGPAIRATLRVRPTVAVGFVVEAYFDGAANRWDGTF
jgi:hypothetical protein